MFCKILSLILFSFFLTSCTDKTENDIKNNTNDKEIEETIIDINNNNDNSDGDEKDDVIDFSYTISLIDEGVDIYNAHQDYGYNYGPSIIKNEDGSYDAWFSSPGNSSSQWDYIRYRHSEDGINWSDSKIVLTPTYGSKDQCSVCDPGVIYFNDYYYLAYTGTDDVDGKGFNNSAFVARSSNPDGPFEKWNGESWGGDPMPIIEYEGNPKGWGHGEISFVIKDNELYIFYTSADEISTCIDLSKADLTDNWPLTIKCIGIVGSRENHDSLDVFYDDKTNMFLAFTMDMRMSEGSRLTLFKSMDGNNFEYAEDKRNGIEDYAHNVGVSKDKNGHINIDDELLVCYAYGPNWGRWTTRVNKVKINVNDDE